MSYLPTQSEAGVTIDNVEFSFRRIRLTSLPRTFCLHPGLHFQIFTGTLHGSAKSGDRAVAVAAAVVGGSM